MTKGVAQLDYNILGAAIRKKRQDLGWKIADLADKVGVSDDFIGKVERATDIPSLQTIVAIANALDVGVDYLLGVNVNVIDSSLCEEINQLINSMEPKQKKLFLLFLKYSKGFFDNFVFNADEFLE